MLNLHPPFRFGQEEGTVEAEENGRVVARLRGRPDGETWRIGRFEIDPERRNELAPRLLAVADAIAADEGLASVTLPSGLDLALRELLDQEGFRIEGGGPDLVRPVVPQG